MVTGAEAMRHGRWRTFSGYCEAKSEVVTTLLTTGGRGGSDIRYNLQIGPGAGVWRPLVEVRDKTRT